MAKFKFLLTRSSTESAWVVARGDTVEAAHARALTRNFEGRVQGWEPDDGSGCDTYIADEGDYERVGDDVPEGDAPPEGPGEGRDDPRSVLLSLIASIVTAGEPGDVWAALYEATGRAFPGREAGDLAKIRGLLAGEGAAAFDGTRVGASPAQDAGGPA